jgi:transposase
VALRLLVDYRDELGHARTHTVNRLHRLLLELLPAARRSFLSAAQARVLLVPISPSDVAGRTRRRLAEDLITELELIDKRMKVADKELRELVTDSGSTLLELFGIGPSSAAGLLGDIGDIARFADRGRFACGNGTAPLDASCGDQRRHRLSRAGNRRINRVLHIIAIVQLRHDPPGRAYYRQKLAAGKTSMQAMRCLKRRLSDIVYRQILRDAHRLAQVREDIWGAATNSSVAGLDPMASTSEKSFPEPANDEDMTLASLAS